MNVGLDCLADMFQMEDDYDNGVVVADMSSALPERQVDYGGPTTPTKQSVTTSPLSPEDRRIDGVCRCYNRCAAHRRQVSSM